MPSEQAREDKNPFDVSEADIDQALAACDGDPRATIRALLIGQAYLERETSRRSSTGYSRRLPLARLSEVQG